MNFWKSPGAESFLASEGDFFVLIESVSGSVATLEVGVSNL